MVTSSKEAVNVLVGERVKVLKARSGVCISKAELAVRVASTNEDIACLSKHKRMVLACSNELDFFSQEVLNKLGFKDIFSRSVT